MNKKSIVLATTNPGKVAELATPLQALNITVLGLDAFLDLPEVEETGSTFEENALLKARTIAKQTGHFAVADDSGLQVDALNGAPGVHSARYSDDMPQLAAASRDERNCLKLIAALSKMPVEARGARFCCAMAVAHPDGRSFTTTGTWEGRILFQPRGRNGFGYDSLFFDPQLGRSAAELTREEKMQHSHRGKALKEILKNIKDFIAQ